jgi:hypothetical protein
MTSPAWFHAMEDGLYGAGDVLLASVREERERDAWPPALLASRARSAWRARQGPWRASERILSLHRLMGG